MEDIIENMDLGSIVDFSDLNIESLKNIFIYLLDNDRDDLISQILDSSDGDDFLYNSLVAVYGLDSFIDDSIDFKIYFPIRDGKIMDNARLLGTIFKQFENKNLCHDLFNYIRQLVEFSIADALAKRLPVNELTNEEISFYLH
jgi:hypothetical protein